MHILTRVTHEDGYMYHCRRLMMLLMVDDVADDVADHFGDEVVDDGDGAQETITFATGM